MGQDERWNELKELVGQIVFSFQENESQILYGIVFSGFRGDGTHSILRTIVI